MNQSRLESLMFLSCERDIEIDIETEPGAEAEPEADFLWE